MPMSWTDDRIELLRAHWEAGMTASQIAEALGQGVSRNAVIGKAHRLGLEARPSPVKISEVAAAVIAVVAAADGVVDDAAPPLAKAPPKRPARVAAPAKPARTTLLDLSARRSANGRSVIPARPISTSAASRRRRASRTAASIAPSPIRRSCLAATAAARRRR